MRPRSETAHGKAHRHGTAPQAAEAFGNLGSFCAGVAENIQNGNRTLEGSWHGVSAEVAWRYFHELAQKLRKAAESFKSLKDQYVQIGRMVFAAAEAVKGYLAGLCDQAVEAIFFNLAAIAALASVYESALAPALEALPHAKGNRCSQDLCRNT
ncbi:hypothetical protein ACIRPT_19775 [Streptomyces sp. NPDC101227]|uniref:hypothetical protein n=1 Tax=Streptomyces sp. NPDC101227 TaxID=3366136 RepID=UPI00381EC8CC